MKVDIWSDVVCPFCYIGKRQFEKALSGFAHKDSVQVVWHSFQLDPSMEYEEGKDIYTYLAERKGQSREWSVKMHDSVAAMARKEGLDYHFDVVKAANSFDAHRLIQYAKTAGKADAIEERLFTAYFSEGAVISDHAALTRIAGEAGLSTGETAKVLASDRFTDEAMKDIELASQIGVTGVPFFVFDEKYAVSGAQGTQTFSNVLDGVYKEQNP